MRLLIIVLALGLSTSLLNGQPPEPPKEDYEAVIIPVKTLSGDSFNRLVKLLGVFNARYTADDKLRTIIVYAPKYVVAEMRRVVAELDRPGSEAAIGRNIEMTLTFLKGSTKAAEAQALPVDLEPVARQLRAVTQYKDIQVWDIVPFHMQEGKATEQSLRLPGSGAGVPNQHATARIRIEPEAVIPKDSGRYVRFDRLNIGFRIPVPAGDGFTFMEVGLNTAGDFKEGQKTVLGKVSGIDDESAIFVVVSLKVLD